MKPLKHKLSTILMEGPGYHERISYRSVTSSQQPCEKGDAFPYHCSLQSSSLHCPCTRLVGSIRDCPCLHLMPLLCQGTVNIWGPSYNNLQDGVIICVLGILFHFLFQKQPSTDVYTSLKSGLFSTFSRYRVAFLLKLAAASSDM